MCGTLLPRFGNPIYIEVPMRREIYKKSEFGFVSGEKDLANDGAIVKILEKVFTLADKIMNMITYSTHLHRIDETKAFRSHRVECHTGQVHFFCTPTPEPVYSDFSVYFGLNEPLILILRDRTKIELN